MNNELVPVITISICYDGVLVLTEHGIFNKFAKNLDLFTIL